MLRAKIIGGLMETKNRLKKLVGHMSVILEIDSKAEVWIEDNMFCLKIKKKLEASDRRKLVGLGFILSKDGLKLSLNVL